MLCVYYILYMVYCYIDYYICMLVCVLYYSYMYLIIKYIY